MKAIIVFLLTVFVSQAAWADERSSGQSSSRNSQNSLLSVQLGFRYFGHYDFKQHNLTPPDSILVEVQVDLWFRNNWAAYLVYGHSIAKASASEYGVGGRIPLYSFKGGGKSGLIETIRFQIVGDIVKYTTVPAVLPYIYVDSAIIPRGGGSLFVEFARSRFYLDFNFLGSRFSSNWFMGPYVGAGLSF